MSVKLQVILERGPCDGKVVNVSVDPGDHRRGLPEYVFIAPPVEVEWAVEGSSPEAPALPNPWRYRLECNRRGFPVYIYVGQ